MSNFDPSSLSYIDQKSEVVRQVIHEAFQNIYMAIEQENGFERDERTLDRTLGGLDKSASELAGLLGIQYSRGYYNDGCAIDGSDDEFGGHDIQQGCELADDDDGGQGSADPDDDDTDDDGGGTESV